jgi:hypothetical protein
MADIILTPWRWLRSWWWLWRFISRFWPRQHVGFTSAAFHPMYFAFDTTILWKTFRLIWFSSAPLRIFACEPLAQWCQTELGSCMNPCLSLHSMLAGRKTFLDWCHSFRASSTATPPLQFLTGTQHDESFDSCCADSLGPASRRGSHVYEIYTWLWNFGRPQPQARVGGLLVAKTERIRRQSRSETSLRTWETRMASKVAAEEIWQTYTWHMLDICLADTYHNVTTYIFWVKNNFCWIMWCPQPW